MVAFVIFWAALFAICFFLAGTLFKALTSALDALLSTLSMIVALTALVGLAILAIALIVGIIEEIVNGGLGNLILQIILLIVVISIFGAIFGGLGVLILSVVVGIISYAIQAVSFVLEKLVGICERGYVKCLTAIVRRTAKC